MIQMSLYYRCVLLLVDMKQNEHICVSSIQNHQVTNFVVLWSKQSIGIGELGDNHTREHKQNINNCEYGLKILDTWARVH